MIVLVNRQFQTVRSMVEVFQLRLNSCRKIRASDPESTPHSNSRSFDGLSVEIQEQVVGIASQTLLSGPRIVHAKSIIAVRVLVAQNSHATRIHWR